MVICVSPETDGAVGQAPEGSRYFDAPTSDGLKENGLLLDEVSGAAAYAQRSIRLYARVAIEAEPDFVHGGAGRDAVLGGNSRRFGPVRDLNSRPDAGVADFTEEGQIRLPVSGIVAAQVICRAPERLRGGDGGLCAAFKSDSHGRLALLQNHATIFKPGFELRAGPNVANMRIGLSAVFDERERHMGRRRRFRGGGKEADSGETENAQRQHTRLSSKNHRATSVS
jgi:hypothetical protein